MTRRAVTVDPRTLPDDTPFRLDVIAPAAFPDGSVSARGLIRESRRGNLQVWRIAGRQMTTMAAIREMVEKCLVEQPQPGSGSGPPRETVPPSGASSTDEAASAQAAALAMVRELRAGSKPTSRPSGGRKRSPNVVPIRPMSPTSSRSTSPRS